MRAELSPAVLSEEADTHVQTHRQHNAQTEQHATCQHNAETHTLSCHLRKQASCFSFSHWIAAPVFPLLFPTNVCLLVRLRMDKQPKHCQYHPKPLLPPLFAPQFSLCEHTHTHSDLRYRSGCCPVRQTASWLQDTQTNSRPTHQSDE